MVALAAAGTTVALRGDAGPAADPCGPAVEKADGTAWECTFADDFDGTALDPERWTVVTGHPSGTDAARACQVDDPRNVAVADGALHLTVRPADEPLTCRGGQPASYASATVSTHRLFSQRYGRFEARVRVAATTAPGLQEAFWLWPDDRDPPAAPSYAVWPAAGEIDVAETYSAHPDLAIPFLHYTPDDNGGPVAGLNTAYCPATRGEWHTYVLEWTADVLRVEVDGETCLENTAGDPAFDRRYVLAFSALLGVRENAYAGTAPLPATMVVDHVRVWR